MMARGKLQAAGIACHLANENMARMGYINAVGGIWLQVDPSQAADALALLQEPIPEALRIAPSSPVFMQPRCPQCSSLRVANEGPADVFSVGSWLNPRFNIRSKANDWRCSE